MIAKKLKITGDVQGVFYRHNAKKTADTLDVNGWTKNEHDGNVTIIAQGDEEKVEKLIEWAREGSGMATVESVEVEKVEIDDNLKGFLVK